MTYFSIGSVTISAVWLSCILALFIAAFLFRAAAGRKLEEWYWNGFMFYAATWKLSYILFHFKLFASMPSSLLYYSGGSRGHYLGMGVFSVYLLFFAKKKYSSLHNQADTPVLFLFYVSLQFILSIIKTDSLEAFFHGVLLAVFLILLKKKTVITKSFFILTILLELLILSFFHEYYSIEYLSYCWVAVLAIILFLQNRGGAEN